jgi:integrase/recombinase XerC
LHYPDTPLAFTSTGNGALRAAIASGFEAQGLTEQSCRRLLQIAMRFVAFVDGSDAESLHAVDSGIVRDFLAAPLAQSAELPSVATSHLRRSAVRLLYSVLRYAGLADHDPTLDVVLPPRSTRATRALTDDEVAVCRSFALQTLTETRQPSAWALAEASGRTSELPQVRIGDIDLEAKRVVLPGGTKVEPRVGTLSEWGVKQLARRLDALSDRSSEASVIYCGSGSAESAQASSCTAISDTLRRAGFANESDVRPVSVAAWAGRHAFEEAGRIEDAALVLGVRSLDRAAGLIGWDWTTASERR